MTEQEIKKTAKLMEEGKLDLKEWLEQDIDKRMKEAGFMKQETPTQKNQKETTPVSGTVTFLKGESAKKAERHYQNKKDKE